MKPVYLDHNATTPVDPDVLAAMLPFLREEFGNPSSSYSLGRNARDAVENARAAVASLIGAHPDEIVFTGGGTESSNIAIRSGTRSMAGRRSIVTTTIEHPATDACCALLAQDGYDIRRAGPDRNAIVDPSRLGPLVDTTTALVTVIHAQNEIGTLQPVSEIARLAKAKGALMHADAAQSLGKVPVDVNAMGVDLLSIAGHKLYAPKGVGALYMRRGIDLPSVVVGAGQEHGRRPGTENVAFIVALGEACRIARDLLAQEVTRQQALRDDLWARLQREVPGIVLVGEGSPRLPNTLNVLFPDVSGRQLLASCPGVMASNGSACHADREDPSAILLAAGIAPDQALGAVRLSVGRYTTQDAVETAAARLGSAWRAAIGSPRLAVTA
jgi:cysteine desulfurase